MNKSSFTVSELKDELVSELNLQGMEIKAEKIIEFMAKNGDINIEGTTIQSEESISMFSSKNTKLTLGNNSSKTKRSEIRSEGNAKMTASGGAGVKQNDDGSISFYT